MGVDLRWLVLENDRGVGVRCDRCPRVQDAVSGGGAILAVAGLRWLRRPHSVVAATTVWLLAVDGKASVVVLLGLRESWIRKSSSQMLSTRRDVEHCF